MSNEKKIVELDDFEAPNGFEREITLHGKTRKYFITELSDAECRRVFNTTNDKGVSDPDKVATFPARAVAACVKRPDGSEITFAEAREMRRPLLDALIKEVLDIHGYGADQGEIVVGHEKN